MEVTGLDGTLGYYDGIMKELLIEIEVPAEYNSMINLAVGYNETQLELCYMAIVWVR